MLDQRVGFIGAGQMARALARGMTSAGLLRGERIVACDPAREARDQFAAEVPGAVLAADNAALIKAADVVVLAVKPQALDAVAGELAARGRSAGLSDEEGLSDDKLLVSIVAGATLARLSARFGTQRIVRVMPNTPCLVGEGAAAYALAEEASAADGELVERMLESVGIAQQVPESQLDAVTGLSGSGPAFVYVMIEALSDGGVRMGLPRATATRLAAQTVLGAARMVLNERAHPAELKDRVASPGGTTIAGLQALEDRGARAAFIAAVQRAAERSVELGREAPK